jgi:hypothetical protein
MPQVGFLYVIPVFERSKGAGATFRIAECLMLSLHIPLRLNGTVSQVQEQLLNFAVRK